MNTPKAEVVPCLFLILFFGIFPSFLAAEDSGEGLPYPFIKRLEAGDPVYKQYKDSVWGARSRLYGNETEFPPEKGGVKTSSEAAIEAEGLTIYAYKAKKGDDVFRISASCEIFPATIATLNRLSDSKDIEPGQILLLPSIPGLFIPEKPRTDLEMLLRGGRSEDGGVPVTISRGKGTERFLFIPGANFTGNEWAFFLNQREFHYPLKKYVISSPFGMRINPVTHHLRFHHGLDLAAPMGSPVFAAADGTVIKIHYNDPIYGNYIVLSHSGGWTSIYGHLSKVENFLVLHKKVKSGTIIGRVGSTGQSTGPHLHFELRRNGKAQDPRELLDSK